LYIGVIGAVTHRQGNTLDLAFLTGLLSATTAPARHLDTTSDYSSLLITVNWNSCTAKLVKKLRLDILDQELFIDLLQIGLALLIDLEENPLLLDLD
jgi:hypothetical protein